MCAGVPFNEAAAVRAATSTTRVAKTKAIADTRGARDRRDGRRRVMLDKSPDELRSQGREVRMMYVCCFGGSRFGCGVPILDLVCGA